MTALVSILHPAAPKWTWMDGRLYRVSAKGRMVGCIFVQAFQWRGRYEGQDLGEYLDQRSAMSAILDCETAGVVA